MTIIAGTGPEIKVIGVAKIVKKGRAMIEEDIGIIQINLGIDKLSMGMAISIHKGRAQANKIKEIKECHILINHIMAVMI